MSENKSAKEGVVVDDAPLKEELDELKREMRSAQWADWAQRNQKNLMIGAAVFLAVLVIAGFLIEQNRAQRGDAATTYQQAMIAADAKTKQTLFATVVSDYGSSTYGALAELQLAAVDAENREQHLEAVIAHPKSMKPWVWQSRLDLAQLKIAAGDLAAAKGYLTQEVGNQYQQLRHYLLAMATKDEAEQKKHLQQALDAESHDEALRLKIQSLLASFAS